MHTYFIFTSSQTHSPVTVIAKLDNYNFILKTEREDMFKLPKCQHTLHIRIHNFLKSLLRVADCMYII